MSCARHSWNRDLHELPGPPGRRFCTVCGIVRPGSVAGQLPAPPAAATALDACAAWLDAAHEAIVAAQQALDAHHGETLDGYRAAVERYREAVAAERYRCRVELSIAHRLREARGA